jgi:alkylated DNA repair dioxygenase AlkB
MEKVFKNPEGTAYLAKGYFTNPTLIDECVAYVKPLLEQKPEVIVYGKKCKQNRNVGFFSEESIGYKYSNNLMKSQPLGDKMSELLATVNNTVDSNFNGVLVNEYKHGKDYIGDHSDDETGLNPSGCRFHIIRRRKDISHKRKENQENCPR